MKKSLRKLLRWLDRVFKLELFETSIESTANEVVANQMSELSQNSTPIIPAYQEYNQVVLQAEVVVRGSLDYYPGSMLVSKLAQEMLPMIEISEITDEMDYPFKTRYVGKIRVLQRKN